MTAALITTIILFIGSVIMYQIKVMDLKKKINDFENSNTYVVDRCKKFLETHNKLSPGRRAFWKYNMMHGAKRFDVQFEVEILSLTENKAKIKTVDFWTDYNWARNNKQTVLNYIDDRWVSSSELKPIMDNREIRQDKLNKLLQSEE